MTNVVRNPDPVAAAEACGRHILNLLEAAISSGAQATLAISGGSSPRPMFQWFARTPFSWDRVQLFWVDERCVPIDHPQSNFKFANDTWLAPGKFPLPNIHRIRTELEPREAAREYAAGLPTFDVIHLGIGPDAHTASLFPGEPLIGNRADLAAAVWVEKMQQWRVTLLPRVLGAARNRVVLVCGADKAKPLDAVLQGPYDPKMYPAQLVRDATWFVDEAAAEFLPIDRT